MLGHEPESAVTSHLADHKTLRLVVLNSCEGAKGSDTNIFSSTSSILMRRGVPAVVAMQYEITDRAAIEFSQVFYEDIAHGLRGFDDEEDEAGTP
jgi:CHAT domain-containing protein